jgi:hypothetical protein
MKIFYSKSTNGFYADEIHGDKMPADVVEITDKQHAELLVGQSAGKRIATDKNGSPILIDQPIPTAQESKAQTNAAIQLQIDTFEKNQARAVREAALGIDGALDRLKVLDQKIRTLAEGFVK